MEYITEAEAIGDYDNCIVEHETDLERFKNNRKKSIEGDLQHYYCNKQAKTGEVIMCAENRCKKRFIKKSYQQAFCCTKHKNKFWNRQRIDD